ncbi:MAG: tRNA (adenosine(37)-N6)-threonylcarbamoyltransferase complex ATPase subunit type 1 TsaE [Bdellovibrionota bacterium]
MDNFKNKEFLISLEDDLKKFAYDFAKVLKPSKIVSLVGELGAGKTTFVKYLVKALNIDASVSSPSYVLENIYEGRDFFVSHWDLYRLSDCPMELLNEDFKNAIVLIEWGDKFNEIESIVDITISFEILENEKRRLRVF